MVRNPKYWYPLPEYELPPKPKTLQEELVPERQDSDKRKLTVEDVIDFSEKYAEIMDLLKHKGKTTK